VPMETVLGGGGRKKGGGGLDNGYSHAKHVVFS